MRSRGAGFSERFRAKRMHWIYLPIESNNPAPIIFWHFSCILLARPLAADAIGSASVRERREIPWVEASGSEGASYRGENTLD